jgi:hypothetical protein
MNNATAFLLLFSAPLSDGSASLSKGGQFPTYAACEKYGEETERLNKAIHHIGRSFHWLCIEAASAKRQLVGDWVQP